jgi:hypothetical protein
MKRYQRLIVTRPLHQPDARVQRPLPLEPEQPAVSELSIDERFARFHAANPHVYQSLRALALAQAAAGARRISPKLLFEQLRAGGVATAQGDDVYRLNNIYTSRYARLLAAEPGLAGRIPTRTLQAE